MSHFVLAARTGTNSSWRLVGIAGIRCRVVVGNAHFDFGTLGQLDRIAVSVNGLPVDIPVAYLDEPAPRTVGKRGPRLDLLSQVVCVRIDSQHFQIDGQDQVICNLEALRARRDIKGPIML